MDSEELKKIRDALSLVIEAIRSLLEMSPAENGGGPSLKLNQNLGPTRWCLREARLAEAGKANMKRSNHSGGGVKLRKARRGARRRATSYAWVTVSISGSSRQRRKAIRSGA